MTARRCLLNRGIFVIMLRKAGYGDAASIQNLIRLYSETGKMLYRPLEEIEKHIGSFIVYESEGEIVGACSLKSDGDRSIEIRSLAVDPRYYRRGIGTALVLEAIEQAESGCSRERGEEQLFVFTYVVSLFQKLGFQIVEKSTLPAKVWNDCKYCLHSDKCDETAMVRPLIRQYIPAMSYVVSPAIVAEAI